MAICATCEGPLTVEIEPDDEDEDVSMTASSCAAVEIQTVPDDVELPCGCHFHWQCLMDAYTYTECPSCSKHLTSISTSGNPQLLCNLSNEGGFQEHLDILPLLTEEAYLKTYPEERRCRAFLEFCREGDVEAIANMLEDGEDDAEAAKSQTSKLDVLRYQDPTGGMISGLHLAVQAQKVEVAWMLLMLASTLDLEQFPTHIRQAGESLGVMREDQAGKVDIRSLQDAEGRTAEQLARSIGGAWSDWIRTGRLSG